MHGDPGVERQFDLGQQANKILIPFRKRYLIEADADAGAQRVVQGDAVVRLEGEGDAVETGDSASSWRG